MRDRLETQGTGITEIVSSVPDVVDVETDKLFAANIFIFLHRQRHYMRFTQTDRAVRKRSDSDFRAEI